MDLSYLAGPTTLEDCLSACCASDTCLIYQFCNSTACNQQEPCWVGDDCSTNVTNSDYISFMRPAAPSPVPPPPQTSGPTTLNYDDSDWRQLNVPHDFIVEGTFSPNADRYNNRCRQARITVLRTHNIGTRCTQPSNRMIRCIFLFSVRKHFYGMCRGHGYLPFNISWYRKHFTINDSWDGSLIWIDFDGVYRNSDVWLNGVWLGHRDSGYVSFRYFLHNATDVNGTAVLNYGGADNVLVVRMPPWCRLCAGRKAHSKCADPFILFVSHEGVFVRQCICVFVCCMCCCRCAQTP
jgi:hypothetical protein